MEYYHVDEKHKITNPKPFNHVSTRGAQVFSDEIQTMFELS